LMHPPEHIRSDPGRYWDDLARQDALHAVLITDDEGAFWASGEAEIAALEREGLTSNDMRALDFGAGIGRLSYPLLKRVAHVVSADVSREMLQRLERREPSARRLETVLVSPSDEEALRGPFDLILSFLVLQHMEPRDARHTLRKLASTLAPKGRIVIDLPVIDWELSLQKDDVRQWHWPRVRREDLWTSRYYRQWEIVPLLLQPAGLRLDRVIRGIRNRPVLVLEREEVSQRRPAELQATILEHAERALRRIHPRRLISLVRRFL
jgi:SAM-dependent methyltransferase